MSDKQADRITLDCDFEGAASDDGDLHSTQGHSASPGASLAVLQVQPSRTVYFLDARGGIIGRDERADVRLSDVAVSRRHARIVYADGAYQLLDLDSRNGTFADDARVTGAARLPATCRLRFGPEAIVHFSVMDALDRSSLERLQQQLFDDPSTGTQGRLGLRARFHEEVSHSMRRGEEIGILLVGLDQAAQGDEPHDPRVIDAVATAVVAGMRDEGSVFRHEGDAFCVLTRGLDGTNLGRMAERIRGAVEQLEIAGGPSEGVTVSVGCASIVPARPSAEDTLVGGSGALDDLVQNALLSLARQALDQAREDGGNCIRGTLGAP